jgi:hypothetical protein
MLSLFGTLCACAAAYFLGAVLTRNNGAQDKQLGLIVGGIFLCFGAWYGAVYLGLCHGYAAGVFADRVLFIAYAVLAAGIFGMTYRRGHNPPVTEFEEWRQTYMDSLFGVDSPSIPYQLALARQRLHPHFFEVVWQFYRAGVPSLNELRHQVLGLREDLLASYYKCKSAASQAEQALFEAFADQNRLTWERGSWLAHFEAAIYELVIEIINTRGGLPRNLSETDPEHGRYEQLQNDLMFTFDPRERLPIVIALMEIYLKRGTEPKPID